MAINGRVLGPVQLDLMDSATTEQDFRFAVGNDVAFQVDANEEALKVERIVSFGGDLTGDNTFRLTDSSITLNAEIGTMRISNNDILRGAIMGDRIATDTITQDHIATTAKKRFQVLSADGMTVLFDLDGLQLP